MMPTFARQTITRVRGALVADGYGSLTERDWTNAVSTTITGVSLQPMPSSEYERGREAVLTAWRLYAPAGTDLEAGDRIVYDGDTYDIEGDSQNWPSPTGQLDHVEAVLRRVVG
jgi:hypothetical protein